jgi:hypothetical protein
MFVPEISRNNFDDFTNNEINYIIGKAIHSGVLEKFNLSNEKKLTLKNFIEHYYANVTEFEKK